MNNSVQENKKGSIMVEPIVMVLSRLRDRGHEPRQSGDSWSCRCPAHEDETASLSIGIGGDGRALICCHAGCSNAAIVESLGLKARDLFADDTRAPSQSPATTRQAKSFATWQAALPASLGEHSAAWEYRDAAGLLVGVVARWDTADGKTFRPASLIDGGWQGKAMPTSRPLYALPELLAGDGVVHIAEGEKSADALRSIGLIATTSSGGAKSAGQSDWSPLAGRTVVVVPDYDIPGAAYARDVVRLATAAGAKSVAIVHLLDAWSGMPSGGDACDWIGHHYATEPKEFRGMLDSLVAKAAKTEPAPPQLASGPVLLCMADVEPCEVAWLWPGRVPLGRLTLLVGRPGEGKSFLTTDMAARVTTGSSWPDGGECPQGSVILISAEDDPGDTIRPRLDAHRADVNKVHLLSAVRRVDKNGKADEFLFTLADIEALEAALKAVPDCRLVVIDPIGSFLGGGTDSHRDNEVRAVLAPVARLAEKHGAAVVVVAHRRKAAGANADESALGSRAFVGLARAVWHLSRDAENKSRRLLLPGKNNLAHEGAGLAFTIEGDPARLSWEADPVDISADDQLVAESAPRAKHGPDPDALGGAADWLGRALADGPRLAKELFSEWRDGEGGSKRSLERAKRDLLVEAFRPEVPGPWSWRLGWVDRQADDCKAAKSPDCELLGGLGGLAKTREKTSFPGPAFARTPSSSNLAALEIADVLHAGEVPQTPTTETPSGTSRYGRVL